MLKIISLIFMLFSFALIADDEKKYTQEQFDAQVMEQVKKKVDRIKKSTVAELTKELLDKEQMLKDREAALAKREEQLKIAEQTLSKKVVELEDKQAKIIGCIDGNEQRQQMRIKQLVEMVSNMKPDKAAQVLTVQEEGISVQILEMIDPKRASKIFNLMDKEKSAQLQKQYLNMQK